MQEYISRNGKWTIVFEHGRGRIDDRTYGESFFYTVQEDGFFKFDRDLPEEDTLPEYILKQMEQMAGNEGFPVYPETLRAGGFNWRD